MLTLIFIIIFILIAVCCWFSGLWSNILTLINLLMAGLIATNFFEPVTDKLETYAGQFTYILDFPVIWALFVIAFIALRLTTECLSRVRVRFNVWVEMAGRSILSLWVAAVFVSFAMFTLHVSPLPADVIQASPQSSTLIGMSPDYGWLAFAQSRSRGALSRGHFSGDLHPDDANKNVQAFDPLGDFPYKYHDRRTQFSQQVDIQVSPN